MISKSLFIFLFLFISFLFYFIVMFVRILFVGKFMTWIAATGNDRGSFICIREKCNQETIGPEGEKRFFHSFVSSFWKCNHSISPYHFSFLLFLILC